MLINENENIVMIDGYIFDDPKVFETKNGKIGLKIDLVQYKKNIDPETSKIDKRVSIHIPIFFYDRTMAFIQQNLYLFKRKKVKVVGRIDFKKGKDYGFISGEYIGVSSTFVADDPLGYANTSEIGVREQDTEIIDEKKEVLQEIAIDDDELPF